MNQPGSGGQANGVTANIRISWQGEERVVAVPVPPGSCAILDLLPAARILSHLVTDLALDRVRSNGRQISCRAGCGACCRQLVAISVVEAQALADLVSAMPPERQSTIRRRFAEAIQRLEQAGLLDPNEAKGERSIVATDQGSREATLQDTGRRYFNLQIPCPFLEDESCSIHPDRPIVCREHHVTTPAENCARLYQIGVDRVEPAARLGEALARTVGRTHGIGPYMIPLVLSLEWAETHAAQLKEPQDSMMLFRKLMDEL